MSPNFERDVKQVLVVRKDLNMRKGKIAAQCAHASMKILLDQMLVIHGGGRSTLQLTVHDHDPFCQWLLDDVFKKVCVYVKSEEELLHLMKQAEDLAFPCALIEDMGLTEFKGKKTKTVLAIGPFWSDELDELTGHLPLL